MEEKKKKVSGQVAPYSCTVFFMLLQISCRQGEKRKEPESDRDCQEKRKKVTKDIKKMKYACECVAATATN